MPAKAAEAGFDSRCRSCTAISDSTRMQRRIFPRGEKILIVDDDDDQRSWLRRVLEDAGAVVEEASSAERGDREVRKIRTQRPLE